MTQHLPDTRIEVVRRHGKPVTPSHRLKASLLLTALLDAAEDFGVTLDDFDWVTDLPGACLDVIRMKER